MHLLVKRVDESMVADVFIVEDKKGFIHILENLIQNKRLIGVIKVLLLM